jgi:hypothetical protein
MHDVVIDEVITSHVRCLPEDFNGLQLCDLNTHERGLTQGDGA